MDSSGPGAEPDVTTFAPFVTGWFFEMYWSCMSFGSPTFGITIPSAPSGSICAATELAESVSMVTVAVPQDAADTWPTRPSPLITGWSTRMPSLLPLSIVTVEYQTVGDFTITRAVSRVAFV